MWPLKQMDVKLHVLLFINNWLSQGLGEAALVLSQFLRITASKGKYNNKATKPNRNPPPPLTQNLHGKNKTLTDL